MVEYLGAEFFAVDLTVVAIDDLPAGCDDEGVWDGAFPLWVERLDESVAIGFGEDIGVALASFFGQGGLELVWDDGVVFL